MFAALRKDWELSESRRDSPAVPLAGPGRRLLISHPSRREASNPPHPCPKRLVRVRLHEPLANCVRFQPSHLIQVLELPAVNTVAVGYSPRTSRAHPTLSLTSTHHFSSLGSRRFVAWGTRAANLNNNLLGPKRSRPTPIGHFSRFLHRAVLC
jgi:hypothetical protein